MYLWVGLGNPGEKYKNTRHNLGVYAIQQLVQEYKLRENSKLSALICEQTLFPNVFIIFPQTYMNRSGESVLKAVKYLNLELKDVVIFHDDVELLPKDIRYKFGGGHKGHNGLRDITDRMGMSDYHRIRLGVGKSTHENMALADFLLEPTNLKNILNLDSLTEIVTTHKVS